MSCHILDASCVPYIVLSSLAHERAAKPKTKKTDFTKCYRFFLFLTGLQGFTINYDKYYRFTNNRVLVVAAVDVAAAAAAAREPQTRRNKPK